MLLKISYFSLFLLLSAASVHAGNFRNWGENSGQNPFAFAQSNLGPRTTSLSGAGGSMPSADPYSVQVNPAALEQNIRRNNFALAWETGALDRRQGLFAWNTSWNRFLVQGIYAWTDNNPIDGVDETGLATGTSYRPFDQSAMITTTFLTQHFRMGVTGKLLRDHLSSDPGDQDGMAWGFDWGLQLRTPSPRYSFGVSVLDLGRQFQAYTTNGVDNLALNTRIRLSSHYRLAQVRGLTILFDTDIPRYTQPFGHLGLEYSPTPWLFLRSGLQRTLPSLQNSVEQVLMGKADKTATSDHWSLASFGFGANWKALTLDYSIQLLRDGLGQQHRIGLRSGF